MCDIFLTHPLNCTSSSIYVPYLTVFLNSWQLLMKICSFSIYDKWTFHCKLSLDWKCKTLRFCLQSWYANQKWLLLLIYSVICIFIILFVLDWLQIKFWIFQSLIFAGLCFCKYLFIIVWSKISVKTEEMSFLNLKQILCHHLHKNPKWTALRHSQMIKVSKQASGSNVFSPLFTRAWKILPGYILFLLTILGPPGCRNLYFQNNFTIKLFINMCLKGFIMICVKFGRDCSLRINWFYVDKKVLKGAYFYGC